MVENPTYSELERKIKKLEKEASEYLRKEREFNKDRKLIDYGHMKRTISLMRINGELNREIKEIKSDDKKNLERISRKLRGRIKELNCLYDISSAREGNDFSLDGILQEMVDFIPPACQYPEITCARIIFESYEFITKNFEDTRWKQSFSITVHNKQIGTLEVCHLLAASFLVLATLATSLIRSPLSHGIFLISLTFVLIKNPRICLSTAPSFFYAGKFPLRFFFPLGAAFTIRLG